MASSRPAHVVLLNSVLLPIHNRLLGRTYVKRRKFLEESQWWPRARLLEFQWRELETLLRHAWTTVPLYQKKYAEAGLRVEDIQTPADFARLPALTRQEVNQHLPELCSSAYHGKLLPSATGGSSGVPTRFYRTIESYDWRTAAADRAYSWTGCYLGERTIYLWGAPVGKVSTFLQWKTALHRGIQNHRVYSTFNQTPELWEEILRSFESWRPPLVVGYVSSLEGFSRYVLAQKKQVPGVKAVIAAAEPVYNSTRELVESAFGAPLFNTYGSREFMSIGAECDRHSGLHLHSENLYVETAAGRAGEPSEILVTDLHNFGMPFLRYEIGDVGTLDFADCPCGRGLPILRSIEGRILDMLHGADGRIVPGEWFPHLLKDIPEILEFQVQQESMDHIIVSAVLSGDLSDRSRRLLDTEATKVFGKNTRIELRRVTEIPLRPSGKRRVTIGLAR